MTAKPKTTQLYADDFGAATTFAERCERMLSILGWTPRKLGRWIDLAGWRKIARRETPPEAAHEISDAIDVADLCGVDPRWLLTGRPAPRAREIWQAIRWSELGLAGPLARDARDHERRRLRLLLEAIATREYECGVCRYCGCTDDRACGDDCYWLDERDATFCSACLFPDKQGDCDE